MSDLGIAPVMPRTAVGVDVGAATFDIEGHHGNWQVVTPSAEIALGRRLSLFAALPIGRVAQDVGGTHVGIGDVALSAKVAVYASEHGGLLLSAGVGMELPTGDDAHGLGDGHIELSPFLVASSVLGTFGPIDWVVHGLASPRFALGSHESEGGAAHGHGSFLAPHGERELFGRIMTAAVYGASDVALGAEGAAVFREGEGYAALRAEAGHLFGASLRLFTAMGSTVLGQRRFGVRGQLGVAWLF